MSTSTRRQFLQRSALACVALGVGGGELVKSNAASAGTAYDYATREAFDYLDAGWNGGLGNSLLTNELAQLGWGEAYFLQGYVLMYRATGDTYYLDKVISHFDSVLANRDSERGVVDWTGQSKPAWRALGSYTAGWVDLADAGGRPTLRLRTAQRPANRVQLTVTAGADSGVFSVTAANPSKGLTYTYDDLTMDPASPDYAVSRINGQYSASKLMLTAVDLRPTPTSADAPVEIGPTPLVIQPYIFAVHTGQIVYPIAQFVRIVYGDTSLRRNLRYAAKAREYRDAVRQAIAVHDEEWRQDESGTTGWYIFPKGSPAVYDGIIVPHNQYLSLARAIIEMHSFNHDHEYWRRARLMAQNFKNDLRVDAAGAYVWNYWDTHKYGYLGWAADDDVSELQPSFAGYKAVEDTNHGFLDVEVAVQMARDHLGVFGDPDLESFALTVKNHILTADADGQPLAKPSVNGAGAAKFVPLAAAYLPFAEQEPSIYAPIHAMFDNQQPVAYPGSPGTILGTASLNFYAS